MSSLVELMCDAVVLVLPLLVATLLWVSMNHHHREDPHIDVELPVIHTAWTLWTPPPPDDPPFGRNPRDVSIDAARRAWA